MSEEILFVPVLLLFVILRELYIQLTGGHSWESLDYSIGLFGIVVFVCRFIFSFDFISNKKVKE